MKVVETEVLRIAYVDDGPSDGWPIVLSHGFPYDIHAFDGVAPVLARAGARVIRPYCRGFGATRFRSVDTLRSGQQAARAHDLVQLVDALGLDRPILGGFDWGGNASCAAAALWPGRFAGLVSYAGYDVVDPAGQHHPLDPQLERVCWYQHLFQTERGRSGLTENRREIAQMLWREWSPGWDFDIATFERSAAAFDNPDFVAVVIHCYRWMFGLAAGDPRLQIYEDRLSQRPPISIPTLTLDGTKDPLKPGGTADHALLFTSYHQHRSVRTGHNLPQELPAAFADAVLHVRAFVLGSEPMLCADDGSSL